MLIDNKRKSVIGTIKIEDKEKLRADLKSFALTKTSDHQKNPLSRDDKKALSSLKNNKDIHISKADKGGGFIILNKKDYEKKIDDILSDTSKFQRINEDTTPHIKKEINSTLKKHHVLTTKYNCEKLVGYSRQGYVHGPPKIHKE